MHERVTIALSFLHSFSYSFTLSTTISKIADFYVSREEKLRLDDYLSPFNLPSFFFNFGLVIEKTREKADYGECCYTATPIQSFSCHLESRALK